MSVNVSFISGIRFSKNILEYINGMTYIYDPEWNPDNFTMPTLPVCFFHVKSMHEIMTSEVSQKQMLFYSSNSTPDKTTANAGVLNVVADNIVIKPKTYKLDVVVPYDDLSLLNQTFVFNTQTLQAVISNLNNLNGKAGGFASYSTQSTLGIHFLRDITKSLITHNYSNNSVEDYINNVTRQPEYNKNSLEAMWQMRRIVKMKVWNSWSYKYVAITDIDITKEGTEDGVYEASITVQEVPIATIKSVDASGSSFSYSNKILRKQGDLAIKLLDKVEII